MAIYVVVLTVLGFLALLSLFLGRRNDYAHRAILGISLLILVFFIGFRDRVGADWDVYQGIFDGVAQSGVGNVLTALSIEPIYTGLNYAVYMIGGDLHLVNFVCSVLMLFGIVRFAYSLDLDPALTLFLSAPYLLFVVGMGYTRQSVAIGLGCAALGYWVNEEKKKFFLTLVLAVGFHYSAIFLFVPVWLKSWRRALVALPLVFVSGYVLVMKVFTKFFGLYVQNTENWHSSGVWLRLGIVLSGVGAFILTRSAWREEPRLFRLVANGSVIAASLVPVAFVASTLADRLCLYLFFIYLAAFGRMIPFSRSEFRSLVMGLMCSATYACFFIWFAISSYAASFWIPYHSDLLR